MKAFSTLLNALILTHSRNRKLELLTNYFRNTEDPDRGYALAVLTGNLSFAVKPAMLREIVTAHVDEYLFRLSYDYVGDLGETIALLWPHPQHGDPLPRLSELVAILQSTPKREIATVIPDLLTRCSVDERWAFVKLVTGTLRIGVSARLAKVALSQISERSLSEIEEHWHGFKSPFTDLFAWLADNSITAQMKPRELFHPLMLAHPIDEEKDFPTMDPSDYQAEWKWDGIRVLLSLDEFGNTLYSRTGDDISSAFPDIINNVRGSGVLDGELLVGRNFQAASFNDLQQRLNRKNVSAKALQDYPAFIRVYDMLFDGSEDLRPLTLLQRRERLDRWLAINPQVCVDSSPCLPFQSWEELADIRVEGADQHGHEGVMIKRKDSPYVAGRPRGLWFKWKRAALLLDAILMYAQRGHGKRSSYYSDYTFGVWRGQEIVPIGKAYFGFTDDELKQLDRFVRANTLTTFGPVRELKKTMVVEVAFDSAHRSTRHKSGIALRFPRINRIRWDKPAEEAETLEAVIARFVEPLHTI